MKKVLVARGDAFGRDLLGQFASITTGYALSSAIRAASLIVLARFALPADFGLFSAVAGVIVIVQACFDLGLARLILREHGSGTSPAIVRAALQLNARLSWSLGAVGVVGLTVVGNSFDDRILFLIPLAVGAAAEKTADTRLSVAIASGRASVSTINLMIRRSLALGLFVILLLVVPDVPVLLAYSLAEAASAVVGAVLVQRQIDGMIPREPGARFRTVAHMGLPFWINSLATQVRNLDVLLATAVAGPVQGGFYAASTRLTSPLQLLASSAATVLLPVAARSQDRRRVLSAALLLTGIMAALYATLGLIAPLVVPIVLGPAYAGATVAIQIVLGGLPFACLSAVLASALQGWGRARVVATTALIFTTLCLISTVTGAVYFGAPGAAAGLASSYLAQSAILFAVTSREARRTSERGTIS